MSYFDSIFFACFVFIYLCNLLFYRQPRIKEWILIVCSLLIIATWGYYDCIVFIIIIVINYVGVYYMDQPKSRRSRCILICLVTINLFSLGLFKYSSFAISSAFHLFGKIPPVFSLGIPLAISFYTFHLISLLIDSYNGKIRRVSLREYCFYLCFFPHVIAGPIIRAWQLIPQIGRISKLGNGFSMGMHYFITGYFLKVVAADNINIGTDSLWFDSATLEIGDRWCLAFLYYCQIYGDFAGYSLMAIGMARLLGYHFPANFRSPMISITLKSFWQRWHISLSRFLRDYLYIPLGGSRGTIGKTMGTVVVTMLLGGLWHGSSWNFVIWGGIHGLGIIVERIIFLRNAQSNRWRMVLSFLFAQMCVIVAWVFFRQSNIGNAFNFVCKMFIIDISHPMFSKPILLIMLLFAVPILIHNIIPLTIWKIGKKNLGVFIGVVTSIMLAANIIIFTKNNTFIYFKF